MSHDIPGWEGAAGPLPFQYGRPHVYARDVYSGSGNCVCGRPPESRMHVPVPSAPLGTCPAPAEGGSS